MPHNLITDFNKINKGNWDNLLLNSPFTTPFQTPAFFDFINSVSGLSAEVFAIEENNGISSLCVITFQKEKGINGFFSRRAIIYGGPLILIVKNRDLTLDILLSYINKELKHKAIYGETRNFNDYSGEKISFIENGWKYLPYLNYKISLQGKSRDDILIAMNYNRRREIQLSFKEGADAKEASNTEEVVVLYKILFDLYKNRVSLPLPGLEFFIKLFNCPIGKVFIVKHNNCIIGGSFCFYYPANSIYTMYYCSLRNYHPKIFPTHLAIMAAVDFGIENNLKWLDLMGAGKPDQEYGVRKYKSEFGGELVEHGRFIKIYNPVLFQLGKLGLSIIKKVNR
jgi:hypothetical protein